MHISNVEPLPHQIAAVYEEMLIRQPLRFLLADDPGAGKTIMAGLLIRELMLRGDLERCLIVCPANLAEQWQDEMIEKFQTAFHIMGRSDIEASASGNPFNDHDLVIGRIDLLKQDDNVERLNAVEWDLVVVDESHKMSAHYYGNEVKRTARYQLGEQLGTKARHLLMMTATPHNGKDEDFNLSMGLLDPDRFEGRLRSGAPMLDPSDIMRRMLKEEMVDFDGHPLFPERRAYTVNYDLSEAEFDLYEAVTNYVTEEMNRADQLGKGKNGERRRTVVGFALTILQRRLASSPTAIHESLKRRHRRLQLRLEEAQGDKFGDAFRRWKHHDELDGLISKWTAKHTPTEVTEKLQFRRVPSFPSLSPSQLRADPHLEAREAFPTITHAEKGEMRAVVPPWRFSKTPSSIDTWTPDLGEHNMDVFHGIIGLPKSEVESLQESQVIW